jgi:hypothetical protein
MTIALANREPDYEAEADMDSVARGLVGGVEWGGTMATQNRPQLRRSVGVTCSPQSRSQALKRSQGKW